MVCIQRSAESVKNLVLDMRLEFAYEYTTNVCHHPMI